MRNAEYSSFESIEQRLTVDISLSFRSISQEVMKILLPPFVCTNQVNQEKRQLRMLGKKERMVIQRMILGGVLIG